MKYLYVIIANIICFNLYAQSPCSTHKSVSGLIAVDAEDVICIAKNSDKDISLFYTFADWCSPCRASVPNIVELAKKNDVALHFLLVDRETESFFVKRGIDFLRNNIEQPSIYIISDSLYSSKNAVRKNSLIVLMGEKEREKYSNFIIKITPPSFKVSSGMGKSILINKEGEVILVTSNEDKDKTKKDGKKAVYQKIEEYIARQRTR